MWKDSDFKKLTDDQKETLCLADKFLFQKWRAGRSPKTLQGYESIIKSFADYLKVPYEQLSIEHLTSKNLMNYKDRRSGYSPRGMKLNLTVLHHFFKRNKVFLDDGDIEVVRGNGKKAESNWKPLTRKMLQDMLAAGNDHSRALITFYVSTGCRGMEASLLKLQDIGVLIDGQFVPDEKGSVIRIPNAIAKGGNGGYVFLTKEARDYMTKWLAVRKDYIEEVRNKNKALIKKSGAGKFPKNDDRIFCQSYESMMFMFRRLYEKLQGSTKITGKQIHHKSTTGKPMEYNQITLHSMRRFFSTYGAKGMGRDLTEFVMRHTGYLQGSYWAEHIEECEREFHKGEAFLTITISEKDQIDEIDKIKKEASTRDAQTQEELKQLRDEVARLQDPKFWLESFRKAKEADLKKGDTRTRKYIDSILIQ